MRVEQEHQRQADVVLQAAVEAVERRHQGADGGLRSGGVAQRVRGGRGLLPVSGGEQGLQLRLRPGDLLGQPLFQRLHALSELSARGHCLHVRLHQLVVGLQDAKDVRRWVRLTRIPRGGKRGRPRVGGGSLGRQRERHDRDEGP